MSQWTAQLLFVLSVAVALTVSPGPRRGLELLRGRPLLALAVAGLAVAVLPAAAWPHWLPGARGILAAAITAITAVLAGLAVASPRSRCLLLLFAIPGIPVGYLMAGGGLVPGRDVAVLAASPPVGHQAAFYALPLVIIGLVVAAMLRARRRAVPGGAS